ncbi:DUF903 domain-containing protein [Sulfuriroseicoccus oceanibius]|uniref:DUF903 domain-containing protein n=1 Tax=Sulfuriroseicoccus oceanibius TaxID=2707525 RepID=A0A6B3L7Y7_9BACT|nr:DUF903 domain-containing protein [Sulfuriroseicoccus oceanibius]QQL45282.1 DUF903 domain-containing protein [Sulfuriroseicoccus oceanibius]
MSVRLIRFCLLSLFTCAVWGLCACQSTPHVIVLEDGRELYSIDEPTMHEKTGYYRFRCGEKKDRMVDASEVARFYPR